MVPSANGISNHLWNIDLGSGDTSIGDAATIPLGKHTMGIRVPYACTLVGFTGMTNSVGNYQSAVGLFCGVPTWNDYATWTANLRAYHAADISAGPDANYSLRPVKAEDLSRSHSLSAGDVIIPAIKSIASNSRSVQFQGTIVLKTLIP
jgi:hypothetical protein